MNQFKTLVAAALPALLFVSCGGGNKQNENNVSTTDAIKALSNVSKAEANVNNVAQEKLKERRAKGDTLAMPYADLQKFLPQSLDGYKTEKPDGATINMQSMSYSSATIRFSKDNGDYLKVSIIDYNQAYGLYTAATALWAMGMSVDSPQEKADGIKLDNDIGGWEDFKKNTNEAIVTLGVGSRFLVSVEASKQSNTDLVKSVAKSMDLSKLAAM